MIYRLFIFLCVGLLWNCSRAPKSEEPLVFSQPPSASIALPSPTPEPISLPALTVAKRKNELHSPEWYEAELPLNAEFLSPAQKNENCMSIAKPLRGKRRKLFIFNVACKDLPKPFHVSQALAGFHFTEESGDIFFGSNQKIGHLEGNQLRSLCQWGDLPTSSELCRIEFNSNRINQIFRGKLLIRSPERLLHIHQLFESNINETEARTLEWFRTSRYVDFSIVLGLNDKPYLEIARNAKKEQGLAHSNDIFLRFPMARHFEHSEVTTFYQNSPQDWSSFLSEPAGTVKEESLSRKQALEKGIPQQLVYRFFLTDSKTASPNWPYPIGEFHIEFSSTIVNRKKDIRIEAELKDLRDSGMALTKANYYLEYDFSEPFFELIKIQN